MMKFEKLIQDLSLEEYQDFIRLQTLNSKISQTADPRW